MLGLVFKTDGLRSQMVFLHREMLMGGSEEWLQISSPIAEANKVDVRRVLETMGRMVCGGCAIVDGFLMVRDALPLANLDINEFERPLLLITTTADDLEKQFTASDAL
jgi:hypothetical protein